MRSRDPSHRIDVLRPLHKRDTDRIHSLLQSKLEGAAIIVSDRTNPQIRAGEVDAFVGTQLPSHHDATVDFVLCRLLYLEPDEPVI